jgi:transposase-like protein
MVGEVRRGATRRAVAEKFGVSKSQVDRWVERAHGKRLDRVDWADRSLGPKTPHNRSSRELEEMVLAIRKELKEISALGEYGAEAIHREMAQRGCEEIPIPRTINRILDRRGQFDGKRRVRRPAPPKGWYLPKLAEGKVELDSFDGVEGLVLEGARNVEVLNGISLHGGLVCSFPRSRITAKITVNCILSHWREFGCPDYVQFDNATVFQGPRKLDALGRVARMALSLGVVPVFAPPRETGFQASIESYNGRWQSKVWNRFHFESRQHLQSQSDKYVRAVHRRAAARIEGAPTRWEVPDGWQVDYQNPAGMVVFIRRTTDRGTVTLLGRTFAVSRMWPHRLVRAEVKLSEGQIDFYALRRRDPSYQPLLTSVDYHFPKRPFRE